MSTYDLSQRGCLSKYVFLHNCIRNDIEKGILVAGDRLPAKRLLAKELSVSVNTVERAYTLLVSEGFVESIQGSGFIVCPGKVVVEDKNLNEDCEINDENEPSNEFLIEHESKSRPIDLKANRCSLELFPLETWSRLMRQVLTTRDYHLLETVPFNGLFVLRKAISNYLYEARGIQISPKRIIVGAGTEYLYGRLLQLLGSQSIFAIEDPGYKKFAEISRAFGTLWRYVPLDEQGISVKALSESRAEIVHVSPANQFPAGAVMSKSRREELLSWLAEDSRRYLIEDDYDSEINYTSKTMPPLLAQDTTQRVIYLNTFSKTLVPSIRISYLVLPESLMNLYKDQLGFYSCTVSSFEQHTLAKFISEGYFNRHLNRLRRYYRRHRKRIFDALYASKIASISEVFGGEVGTHFLLRVDTSKSDQDIHRAIAQQGATVSLLSDYCAFPDARFSHCLVINFASIPPFGVDDAISLLERVFQDEIDKC